MSYVYYNPNPLGLSVGDCTIRAISRALNTTWEQTYNALARQGFEMCDMPSANRVWGTFLKQNGFQKHQMPDLCPDCYTVRDFCYNCLTPQYDHSMARGYSRTGSKTEMVEELKQMMNETTDQTVKTAIQDAIAKMNK